MRLGALCVLAVLVGAAPAGAAVGNYSLGDVTLPDSSLFGPLPVRLQGAIGVPNEQGRYPLLVVAHGRHPTGCPLMGDFGTWPCFDAEQRNDLGLRHIVGALSRRGFVALAPDLNGAHTEGWGEPDDLRRWPRIVNRTLKALARDVRDGGVRFGFELGDRVRLGRVAFLGHSLSGLNVARVALRRSRETDSGRIARGFGPLRAMFLLAPVDGVRLADIPTAVVVGTCDGDTGLLGRSYLNSARRDPERSAPVFELTLRQANHNFYNRTLARLGQDDAAGDRGRCRRARRLHAADQQRFAARTAADFFLAHMGDVTRPAWLRRRGPAPRRVHGLPVGLRRLVP